MTDQLCQVCGTTILGRRAVAKTCSQVCADRLVYLSKRDDLLQARAVRYRTDPTYRWKIRIHAVAQRLVPVLGPCVECGKPGYERHHDSDARPYDVRVLCRSCHRRHHLANPGAELIERSAS